MGYKTSTRISTKLNLSVKTAVLYGSLGMAVGAVFCSIVLLIGNLTQSSDALAGRINATVCLPKTICYGDSASLQAGGGEYYRWEPATGLSDADVANPKAAPVKSSLYTVTIYKSIEAILDESGRYPLTSEILNSNDKTLYETRVDIQEGRDFVIQFQARTISYLDRGVISIVLNGKSIGTYNIDYKFNKPFEYIWNNKKEGHADISISLKSYDGDAEAIECSNISMKELASTTASVSITVDKHCTQCPPPQGIKETVLNTRSVKISWDKNDKGKRILRFKKVGEKNWMFGRTKSCSYIIEELDPSFDYELQMMCYCDKKGTDSSSWSNIMLLKASDRLIADVISKNEKSYKGVILPITIFPDSLNFILETTFGIDSPSDEVRLEVWNDKGKKFYSNYLPIENGKVDERLHFDRSLTTGKYMVRIVDGDKTYMNQFEVQ